MDFSSLPSEYRDLLGEAEAQHGIALTPLQALGGGRTGALLFLVSAAGRGGAVQHYILKLDRLKPGARSEEIRRHRHAQENAPPAFARDHMAGLAFSVERDASVAIFYSIAGQSLLRFKPLSAFERQDQQEGLFQALVQTLLAGWNARLSFQPGVHPRNMLETWLGYRILPRGNLIPFFENTLGISARTGSLLIDRQVYPNPLAFCLDHELWSGARSLDAAHGFQHGDLNVANVLASFRGSPRPDGLYLIDFALYKADMPLFYDLAYLEMSYLLEALSRGRIERWWSLVRDFGRSSILDARSAPMELAGPAAVLNAGRAAFRRWIEKAHPSLQDDLEGQFWLAAVAAGLNFANKPALTLQERTAGVLYAAAHLQRYCDEFRLPLPLTVAALDPASAQPLAPVLPPPASSLQSTSLPRLPDAFIGRSAELSELTALILQPSTRLVTLTGPGGTGKTRLALRAAEQLQSHFSAGAAFVSLAEIRDPQLLINRIAGQFGLREGGSLALIDTLRGYLSDKQLLLVLDNFEQVASAAPRLSELLEAAPGVRVLVTSRVLLNLRGEQEFSVPPLSLPSAQLPAGPDEALDAEAVQLFVQRAQSVNRRFTLTPQNTPAVVEICRRLDGLPLAIELAAARTRLLPPEALLARLDSRLTMLTGGARDLPDRQRTLRAAIDWSYDLLEPDQQRVFARLGIFVGGFSLEAAEEVCDLEGSLDILSSVEALVQNSLLRTEDTPVGVRFSMLETVREYAAERLAASGELESVSERRAAYYIRIMEWLAEFSVNFSNTMERWLDWIALEHENLRAVMKWVQSRPEWTERGASLILGMGWYWYRRGHLTEGRAWSDWALLTRLGHENTALTGMLLSINTIMAMHQGDLEIANQTSERQLAIGYAVEDDALLSIGMIMKGMILTQVGQHEQAYTILEQARRVSSEIKLDWWTVDALLTQVTASLGMNDLDSADRLVREAGVVSRSLSADWIDSYVHNLRGEVQRMQGDYAAAARSYQLGEALLRKQGDRGGELPRIIHSQGYTALRTGDVELAVQKFSESLEIFRKIGSRRGISECIAGLAVVRAHLGEHSMAVTLISAASSMMKQFHADWWPTDRAEIHRALEELRQALPPAEYDAAWQHGWTMPLDDAVNRLSSRQLA